MKIKNEIYKKNRITIIYIMVQFFLFGFSSTVQAGNFTVTNVTQFQTALNTAATNGQNDTINVQAGTYSVNPTLTYSTTENYFILIRGIGSPVLTGGNTRQVITLTSTTGNGVIFVEGLVIQNGRADYGGGLNIQTQGGEVRVNNCTVNDNTANFVAGGINIFSNTGNITVTNCSFNRNSSPNTTGYPYGTAGGLFIQTDGVGTSITVTGCNFQQNTAQRDAAGAMLYPLGSNSTVIAESNTFTNNTAKEAGGGCWIRCPSSNANIRYRNNTLTGNSAQTAGIGGGTYIQIASGIINLFDNTFSGNYSIWEGGGLWIEHSGGTLNIFRNKFSNNNSGTSGGGAYIFLDNGTARIYHNIFNKNRGNDAGGGLNLATTTGSLNLYNNTFYLNTSIDGGDVNFFFDNASSSSSFFNNILYNSSLPALSYTGQQDVIARYSDIKGGTGKPWFGIGCIDIYPMFIDTAGSNFHLQDSIHCGNLRFSQCIDAGNPTIQDSLINCSWGLNLTRCDMGAYGGKGAVSIGIKKLSSNIPKGYFLSQNYPNPFNPNTIIKFSIPENRKWKNENCLVILKIYNILGKEVTTLVNENLNAGEYEVTFDGSGFSSGIYFYKLETGIYSEIKKMVLIK